ncbi:hypothetical protein BDF19DRAFT_133469, partial [Syncephalis fuscata]
ILWILGAQPPRNTINQSITTTTTTAQSNDNVINTWPYQQAEYWIARGKFEEACGEITEAFHVYDEAAKVLPANSIIFQQALQEFTDRMARSGLHNEKNKPRILYSQADISNASEIKTRRHRLIAELEAVFGKQYRSTTTKTTITTITTNMVNTSYHLNPIYDMSPPMIIRCIQPEPEKTTTELTTEPTVQTLLPADTSSYTNSSQSRLEKKRLAQASDDGQLPTATLEALSLISDDSQSSDSDEEVSPEQTINIITVIDTTANQLLDKQESSNNGDQYDEGDEKSAIQSIQKTPEKTGTRRRPRTPEETSPNDRPSRRIRSMGHQAKSDDIDPIISTFTALTPIRASKIQQSEFGVNMVISPVRRSIRLLPKDIELAATTNEPADTAEPSPAPLTSKAADEQRLAQLLREQGFAYLPNKALSLSTAKVDVVPSPSASSTTAESSRQ